MSNSVYDEKGILKPEYVWTESERKKLLFSNSSNDDIKISKVDGQKTFNQMQKTIMMNNISFRDFETYYNLLKKGITAGLIENYLPFLLALSSASVLPITTDEEAAKLVNYREQLTDLIASEIRKGLENQGVDLAQYFENAKSNINNSVLRVAQYCDYCEHLRLAIMAKVDNVDCLELISMLQEAQIEPTKTYDEAIKLNGYGKLIASYASQFEQTKGITKK